MITIQEFKEQLKYIDNQKIIHITRPASSEDKDGIGITIKWVKDSSAGREHIVNDFAFSSIEEAMQAFELAEKYFRE